jgi:hypothetical protein
MAPVYVVTAGSGDTYRGFISTAGMAPESRLTWRNERVEKLFLGHDHPGQARSDGSATEVISASSCR